MGNSRLGEPDTHSYYYYETTTEVEDRDDVSGPPADVTDFVGRESR